MNKYYEKNREIYDEKAKQWRKENPVAHKCFKLKVRFGTYDKAYTFFLDKMTKEAEVLRELRKRKETKEVFEPQNKVRFA